MNIKKYFGKDWKHYWRYDTKIGSIYGAILSIVGITLLNFGRKCLRHGGGRFNGKFYQYCSWCGESQDVSIGVHKHFSRKGGRCGIRQPLCHKQPIV